MIQNIKARLIKFFILLAVLPFLSCDMMNLVSLVMTMNRVNSASQLFSYPPGTSWHENNWEYLGEVVYFTRAAGSLANESEKTIRIFVKGRDKRQYLFDEYKINCAGIHVLVQWEEFDEIKITLTEYFWHGPEVKSNVLSQKEESPPLMVLEYRFNKANNVFELESKGENPSQVNGSIGERCQAREGDK